MRNLSFRCFSLRSRSKYLCLWKKSIFLLNEPSLSKCAREKLLVMLSGL